MRAKALFVVLAVAGCAPPEDGESALPAPSRDVFRDQAGPILEKRCCDAGACHGVAERPYALYAVGRRRLDPTETYAATPLHPAEIDANYESTLGFIDATRGRETTLIKKALAVGGKGGHQGGAIFEAPSDPACVALIDWIEGKPW